MLTKEERAAIAERLKNNVDYITIPTLYKALTGGEEPSEKAQVRALCVIAGVIFDLCDTSNIVELPCDKDGEVIRVGDTVFNEAGDMLEVKSIEYSYCDRVYINAFYVETQYEDVFFPSELTNKKPSTIAENIEAFNEAVNTSVRYIVSSMNKCVEALSKLTEVFNSLGDSDD